MRHYRYILVCGLACAIACGTPTQSREVAPQAKEPPPNSATPPPNSVTPPPTSPPSPSSPAPEPAPIDIPNGRLHDGYVVGGLPSRRQFDLALEAGFDSAMSLMSNEEEGISDIAPYASSLGVRYIRFTIKGKGDLTEAMAWQFASTLAVLGKPAIIHSAKGERVGAMFALMAFFVDEVSEEEALAIGAAAGMGSLRDHVRSVLIR